MFVHRNRAAKPLTLLIEEYSIVLGLWYLLVNAQRRILLLTASKINFLLNLSSLISWHELLSMLIGISELTRAFIIKVSLWTLVEGALRALFKVATSIVVLLGLIFIRIVFKKSLP